MRKYPTLRQISIGFSSLFMIILLMIVFVLLSSTLMKVIDDREKSSVQEQMRQTVSHLRDNLESLSALTQDKAQTIAAQGTPGTQQVPSVLTLDTYVFELYNIDLAFVSDFSGNIYDAQSYDTQRHEFTGMEPNMTDGFQEVVRLVQNQSTQSQETGSQNDWGLAGFFETESTGYAAAAYPIMDTANPQTPLGVLILCRRLEGFLPTAIQAVFMQEGDVLQTNLPQNPEKQLNSRFFEKNLSDQSGQPDPVQFALSQTEAKLVSLDDIAGLADLTKNSTSFDTVAAAPDFSVSLLENQDRLSAVSPLPSFMTAQNLAFVYQSARTQPYEAAQSLASPLLALAVLSLIVIGLMAFVVDRFMYKPLQSLAGQVASVDINKAQAPIVNQYQDNELNFLAGAIQDMLNRIAVNQETIQTSSAWLQIYSKAINTTADDFLIMSPEGVIEFMNPAAMRNMSNIDDQLLGKDIWSYIENTELATQIKEMVFDQQTWRGEIVFRPKSEPETFFIIEEATFSPVLNEDGEFEHITLIKHSIQVKKHYENLIQRLAHYNALTQLPNRLSLRNQLEELISSKQPPHSFTVFELSINNFKFINDTVGHAAGDQLLQHIAEKLQNSFSDAHCVANTHGDVFALVFLNMDDNEAIANLAHKRLTALFAQPFIINKREYLVSVAIGASVYPVDGTKADALLQCAETAMYAAKSSKSSLFLRFDISFFQAIERRLTLERELRQALALREFIVYYQPKVEIATYKVIGSEALIRWNNDGKLVMPGQFIPLAEETGLIVPITWFVLEEACRQTVCWHDLGFDHLSIAVNISPQVLMEPAFSERVDAILADTGLPPQCLKLEITEETLLDDRLANNILLKSLRTKGIQISIDDFGTGYSSLLYLKELSLDEIKLDRIFISGIPDSPEDMVIVQATTSMAHALGMRAVAEGVETKEQLDALTQLYCNEFQGFYYSAPVPHDVFINFLMETDKSDEQTDSEFLLSKLPPPIEEHSHMSELHPS